MQRPLPAPLATFPGFRDAYDKYCLAPWSCYRAIEHELIPRIKKAHSKSGMSSDFKTGVQALIDCMKFATVAAERAADEDSIDLVAQTGRLQKGAILAYDGFATAFTHRLSVTDMPEGWQRAERRFMEEWAHYQQRESTVVGLLRSILSEVDMPTDTSGRREPDHASNGAWKDNWLSHIISSASATHRACSTIRKHGGNEELYRRLVLLSINVFNYSTSLEPHCLFPSDDLICGAIGNAKLAIYTHPDLVNSYYGPEVRASAAPSTHAHHSLASPLVLKSQSDRQHRRHGGDASGW